MQTPCEDKQRRRGGAWSGLTLAARRDPPSLDLGSRPQSMGSDFRSSCRPVVRPCGCDLGTRALPPTKTSHSQPGRPCPGPAAQRVTLGHSCQGASGWEAACAARGGRSDPQGSRTVPTSLPSTPGDPAPGGAVPVGVSGPLALRSPGLRDGCAHAPSARAQVPSGFRTAPPPSGGPVAWRGQTAVVIPLLLLAFLGRVLFLCASLRTRDFRLD